MKTPDPRASVVRCENPVLVREGSRFACGRCLYCINRWKREIQTRAKHEAGDTTKGGDSALITLTIADEHMPALGPDLMKRAFHDFAKSVEQRVETYTRRPSELKWIAGPEFGEATSRLHAHAVAFHVPSHMLDGPTRLGPKGQQWIDSPFYGIVTAAWRWGHIKLERVKNITGAVGYVVDYVVKGRAHNSRLRDQWKLHAAQLRKRGKEPMPFETAFWVSWPRGRRGGLSRGFADTAATAFAPYAIGKIDLPIGTRKGSDTVTRYERRRMRKVLGLDSEAHKLARREANPETWEMRFRVKAAGSVRALRKAGGHIDADIAAAARIQVETRQRFGNRGAGWRHGPRPSEASLVGLADFMKGKVR